MLHSRHKHQSKLLGAVRMGGDALTLAIWRWESRDTRRRMSDMFHESVAICVSLDVDEEKTSNGDLELAHHRSGEGLVVARHARHSLSALVRNWLMDSRLALIGSSVMKGFDSTSRPRTHLFGAAKSTMCSNAATKSGVAIGERSVGRCKERKATWPLKKRHVSGWCPQTPIAVDIALCTSQTLVRWRSLS